MPSGIHLTETWTNADGSGMVCGSMASNPRQRNGARRRAIKRRWQSIGDPCHICGKPIDYSLGMIVDTSTGKRRPHPMSLAIDEIIPVSLGGDPFDFSNTRPTHWICNAQRGNGKKKQAPTTLALPQPFDDW